MQAGCGVRTSLHNEWMKHSGNARIKRSSGATLAVSAQANFKICWEKKSSRKERRFSHRGELPVLAAALLAFCKPPFPPQMVPGWCCCLPPVVMVIITHGAGAWEDWTGLCCHMHTHMHVHVPYTLHIKPSMWCRWCFSYQAIQQPSLRGDPCGWRASLLRSLWRYRCLKWVSLKSVWQ